MSNCNTSSWWDFPSIREGAGLLSRNFEISEESGTSLASAEMIFKLTGSDTPALTLSDGSGLTLTSTTAGAWVITQDQINSISLSPGVYFYTLKTTDTDGLVSHYLNGTLKITDV